MKILQVSTIGVGDPRYYRSNEFTLCRSLARLGHEITLFSSDRHPKWQMLEERRIRQTPESVDGFTIRRFPSGPELGTVPLTPTLLGRILDFPSDVIHAHEMHSPASFYSALASRIRRKPLVISQHDYCFGATHGARLFAYMTNNATLGRFTVRSAHTVIGLSSEAVKFAESLGASRSKTCVVPNSVDTTLFRPDQRKLLKEEYEIDAPVVLFVGRLARDKACGAVLRAFHDVHSAIPGVNLVIIGRGPEESRLHHLKEDLKLDHVFFLGRIRREEMQYVYPSCDVLVLPSLYEPFGNVVLEAMASGLPVIGSKIGGMADMISHGQTGYHIEPGNAQQISRYLRRLLTDKELRVKMCGAARHVAEERYDDMAVARKVERIYQQCFNH